MNLIEDVKRHAVGEVWANPHIDKQFTFKPSRITDKRGARGVLKLPYSNIYMPNNHERFVVFELGQISPKLLGFDGNYQEWQRLDEVCERQELVATAHLDYLIVPNTTAYVKRNQNRNFLLAIRRDPNRTSLDKKDDLYVRFYSNAWNATVEGRDKESVNYYGGVLGKDITIPQLLSTWNKWKGRSYGDVLPFVDGFYVSKLTGAMLEEGQYVELYFDGTIEDHFDVYLDNLEHFTSPMDATRKLLIMSPDRLAGSFHFYDDLEFFICSDDNKNGINFYKGAYYSRTKRRDVRQITQQDWAIDSEKMRRIISEQEGEIIYASAFIRVFLRKSVGPSPYLQNANYTHDLFLLPFEERERLMVGPSAVIDEWKASNLEQSAYNMFVSATMTELNSIDNVFSFYGADRILERERFDDVGRFVMPPTMIYGGHVMEYDVNGLMINTRRLEASDFNVIYSTTDDVAHVEFYPGEQIFSASALDRPSLFSGEGVSEWDEVRFVRKEEEGVWEIAEENTHWNITNGRIIWLPDYATSDRLKRHAGKYYLRSTTIHRDAIGLSMPIFEDGSVTDSGFGFKRVDVWLNKRRLVRGVDYRVHFPDITIRCEEYIDKDENDLVLVAHGVPPEEELPHWGFVQDRQISKDDRFNLHLFRNKNIVVVGAWYDENSLSFGEGYRGVNNDSGDVPETIREGALFGIENPISHVSFETWRRLGVNQVSAAARTKEIENYLTKFYHERPDPPTIIIPYKHTVVSEGFRKVLESMRTGALKITRISLSDTAMGVYLRDFISLIGEDVQYLDTHPAYIEIAAHASDSHITLSSAEYQFFVRMNEIYYDNRIVLNNYFVV